MVQREHHFAIVDEVDSILIDEARTPLIISGPSETSIELYEQVNKLIPDFNSDDYEIGKQLFSSLQCVQCHAVNRTGIGAKGPNLTLYGLRTSLAAGWMRNDKESLAKWLKNSQEVKFGNLMWNGEGVGENHPLRQLENDDQKVNQLIEYLLGQI